MVVFRRSLSRSISFWLWFSLVAVPVWAQAFLQEPTEPAAEAAAPQPEIDPDTADISITATVRAREVRFDATPQVRVEFSGQPERLTEDTTVRTNLPDKVQPGVVYRDIEVRLKIVSVFADVERIVEEALGLNAATGSEPRVPLAAPAPPGEERRP